MLAVADPFPVSEEVVPLTPSRSARLHPTPANGVGGRYHFPLHGPPRGPRDRGRRRRLHRAASPRWRCLPCPTARRWASRPAGPTRGWRSTSRRGVERPRRRRGAAWRAPWRRWRRRAWATWQPRTSRGSACSCAPTSMCPSTPARTSPTTPESEPPSPPSNTSLATGPRSSFAATW